MPNAMCAGSDGYLYYPAVAAGQVWRVHPDHGRPELIVDGLAMPTSVKFSPQGDLVVTEAATGRVSRIDIATRGLTSLARLRPGIDNCEYGPAGGLFVSHFIDGGLTEILGDGNLREVLAPGLLGPWGIAVDADGLLYVADGMRLLAVDARGRPSTVASYTSQGFPGFLRNVVVLRDGSCVVSTSAGGVAYFRPGEEATMLAVGLDQITGLAEGSDGTVIVAESGTGRLLEITDSNMRVIASGLGTPTGVICRPDGACVVSDARSGRILHVGHGETRTIASGLQEPHGLVCHGDGYVVVDRGARALLNVTQTGDVLVIAAQLPMGVSVGANARVLPGTDVLPGPLIAYGGLAEHDGAFMVACDANGSVLELRPRMAAAA